MYISPQNPYGYNFCPCCGHKINQMPPCYSGPLPDTGKYFSQPFTTGFQTVNLCGGERSEPSSTTYPIRSPDSFLDLLG